jgi:hypothetical protein
VPDIWPGYDVIAQPNGGLPQRISVKSRTYKSGSGKFVVYLETDDFDWLAIVILPGENERERRFFLIPREIADKKARRDKPSSKTANERYWRIDEVARLFADYEGNFSLRKAGRKCSAPGM